MLINIYLGSVVLSFSLETTYMYTMLKRFKSEGFVVLNKEKQSFKEKISIIILFILSNLIPFVNIIESIISIINYEKSYTEIINDNLKNKNIRNIFMKPNESYTYDDVKEVLKINCLNNSELHDDTQDTYMSKSINNSNNTNVKISKKGNIVITTNDEKIKTPIQQFNNMTSNEKIAYLENLKQIIKSEKYEVNDEIKEPKSNLKVYQKKIK